MSARPSFRRRLLVRLGGALAAGLAALGVLVWLAAYAGVNYGARAGLEAEAREVAAHVVRPSGRLAIGRYAWQQPHHRFSAAHIDPYFLQLFDAQGRLLRASENVAQLGGEYPRRLVAGNGTAKFTPLETFRVGEHTLYAVVHPIRTPSGRLLGYVQVARYEPGVPALMARVGLGLLTGLGLLLAVLGGITWAVAGRVVRPLQAITDQAEALAPDRLSARIALPAEADRETAQLAATLNALLGRLDRSFDEMQRFTSNAAHELQTPLTVLLGQIDVALRRERRPEQYRETLAALRAEVQSLSRMVRGLLTLARLDRDGQALPAERFDLAALVRAEAGRFAEAARARGLDLRLCLPDALDVRAQPELLREVVANLLDNAVKYTEAGHVEVALAARDGEAVLTVVDSGPGMAPEVAAQAADRFYRAPQTAGTPGHGLGLALAQQIVRRHGGRLEIAAREGAGTQVRVALPLG